MDSKFNRNAPKKWASKKFSGKKKYESDNEKNQDSENSSFGNEKSNRKSKDIKKDKKPVFERFRDDSRPSDFGTGRGRRSESSSGHSFQKNKPESTSTPYSKKSSGFKKPHTGNKPLSEKGDVKQNKSFHKPKHIANPFDLDESDFNYAERAEKTTKSISKTTDSKRTFSKRAPKTSSSKKERESDGLVRLNKYIANAGICSRREADELIATGVVQVNGKTITEMGYKVKPTDIIKYGGQTLRKERLVYLILNKPKDYITTVDDPQERRTVLELIHGACRERIYPVGRLDRATTGLLMFTNDGELTKRLTHPRYGVRKIYHVSLDKPLKRTDLDKIAEGIELEDGLIQVDEISYVGDGSDKAEIGVELHSGKNRIVRRIFEHVGYNVRKLDRVMFGPLNKKDLPRGRWRFLTEAEIGMLKMVSAKG